MLSNAFVRFTGPAIEDVIPDSYVTEMIPEKDYCFFSASYMAIFFAESRAHCLNRWKRVLRDRFPDISIDHIQTLEGMCSIPCGETLQYKFVSLTKAQYMDCSKEFKDYIANEQDFFSQDYYYDIFQDA